MARLPRLFLEGVPSHVIVRGNNRQAVFRGDGDRIFFHRCLAELARETAVEVHAYVLMTNHVHLLATGPRAKSLSTLVQRLGRRYVSYFNYLHGRSGTLWEGRFKSTLVQADRYFMTCQRYIELNPARAGIVGHPGQFPWSSHAHHAEGQADDAVTRHPLFLDLGVDDVSRQAAYRELFETDIDAETVAKIRDATQNGWILGTDDYCRRVAAQLNRRPAKLPLGRPRQCELT